VFGGTRLLRRSAPRNDTVGGGFRGDSGGCASTPATVRILTASVVVSLRGGTPKAYRRSNLEPTYTPLTFHLYVKACAATKALATRGWRRRTSHVPLPSSLFPLIYQPLLNRKPDDIGGGFEAQFFQDPLTVGADGFGT